MNTIKNSKAHLSLLLGITAGFAFLLFFFAGVGLDDAEFVITGAFFTLVLIAIIPLLLRKKPSH